MISLARVSEVIYNEIFMMMMVMLYFHGCLLGISEDQIELEVYVLNIGDGKWHGYEGVEGDGNEIAIRALHFGLVLAGEDVGDDGVVTW